MFTQFEIQPVLPPIYVDKFVAEVEFMSGDADGYETERFVIEQDALLDFANFMKACQGTESQSAGGPGYSWLDGYNRWGTYIPKDMFCSSIQAALESWKVLYFDNTGAKHLVEFK